MLTTDSTAACKGTKQSPIQIPTDSAFPSIADVDRSIFTYTTITSDGSNTRVINNGHTIQVAFPSDYKPNVTAVVKGDISTTVITSQLSINDTGTRVRLTPVQLHFHTYSEHTLGGVRYPLEMHIVHLVYKDVLPGCGTGGCIAVLGVLFEVTNEAKGPEFLDTIFKNMPMQENASLTVIVLLQLPS
eukprot:jgi/Chrzof1/3026/Cz12g08200.t1